MKLPTFLAAVVIKSAGGPSHCSWSPAESGGEMPLSPSLAGAHTTAGTQGMTFDCKIHHPELPSKKREKLLPPWVTFGSMGTKRIK